MVCPTCLIASEGIDAKENSFWTNEKVDLAYQKFDYYFNSKGHFISTTPRVVVAKLWMQNWWFSPDPGNNRFNDLLLAREVLIEEKNIEIHILKHKVKKARKRTFIFIVSSVAAGFVTGFIVFK